jgi:hypothetical protein
MMFAWSFAAKNLDELGRLLRALGKHRYVEEVDHRIHWMVDEALRDHPLFAPHAQAFDRRRVKNIDLEIASRDPSLWRTAPLDEIVAALSAFWSDHPLALERRDRLREIVERAGLPVPEHAPFESSPESPPHPELIQLDWVLYPVDQLDAERHQGALDAMEEWGEEIENPSAPIYQEGPVLALPELCEGMKEGRLVSEWLVWSEPPLSYADYVFRGASKAAKLEEPPVGYHDL